MRRFLWAILASVCAATPLHRALAEELIWGIQVEQLEYRFGESGEDVLGWDFDVIAGSDELKFVWRSEAEYEKPSNRFESLENQLRFQVPISDFFDVVGGIRLDTPKEADRISGIAGLHGLAKQWFEVDADLFLSEKPSVRLEIEYEGLITNYITLTPSLELDMALVDDEEFGLKAWGPKAELGARLGYDLIDRAISPYMGVHYEQFFGATKRLAEADGEKGNSFFVVFGVGILL